MANPDLVAKWLMRLGRVVSATITDEQAQRWFESIGPLLADRYPDEAFNLRSLEYVASESKFLPNYAEIVERLSAWWKNNRPQATGITRDRFATDDFATEQRAASWRNMTPDDVRAKIRALDGHPMRRALGRVLAKGLEVNAPHLRPMLPPEFLAPDERQPAEVVPIETAAERFRTTHGRLPGQLTAEQVAKMREDAKPQPAA